MLTQHDETRVSVNALVSNQVPKCRRVNVVMLSKCLRPSKKTPLNELKGIFSSGDFFFVGILNVIIFDRVQVRVSVTAPSSTPPSGWKLSLRESRRQM